MFVLPGMATTATRVLGVTWTPGVSGTSRSPGRLTGPGRAVQAWQATTTSTFTHQHRVVCTPARCRGPLLVPERSWSREMEEEEEEGEGEEEELSTLRTLSHVPSPQEVPGLRALSPPPPLTTCRGVSPALGTRHTRDNTRANRNNNTNNSHNSQAGGQGRRPSPRLSIPGWGANLVMVKVNPFLLLSRFSYFQPYNRNVN